MTQATNYKMSIGPCGAISKFGKIDHDKFKPVDLVNYFAHPQIDYSDVGEVNSKPDKPITMSCKIKWSKRGHKIFKHWTSYGLLNRLPRGLRKYK